MEQNDFRSWDKKVTSGQTVAVPRISSIAVTKFCRGSKLLHFEVSYSHKVFKNCDFIIKKAKKRNNVRGMSAKFKRNS